MFIESEKNLFIDDLDRCKANGYKTYIYGAGEGAENIIRRFGRMFNFDGMLVDEKFYTSRKGVYALEQVVAHEKINLVIGHRGFDKEKLKPFEKNINMIIDRDCFAGNYEADPNLFNKKFVEENSERLKAVYNELQDEESKCAFVSYINQKISMDYKFLKTIYSKERQYFDPRIIKLHEGEAFVDCGAYVGDTAEAFVKSVKEAGVKDYEAIYSFEPDENNYKRLKEKGIPKLQAYCMGVSSKTTEMQVVSKGKGSSSFITDNNLGEGKILKIDALDNVLKNKPVTFIKMDIEGYELEALKGAEFIIKNNRPKLAICIYHKKQDLYEIQEYIRNLVPDYKFFVRIYDYTATELVLYAVINND